MVRSLPLVLAVCLAFSSNAFCSKAMAQDGGARGIDSQAVAQQIPETLQALEDAFARGDAGDMIRYCARRIDVTLFGTTELFSRSQARYVLRAFFDEYRPERVSITETSGSEGNWFAAGRYWYVRGDVPLSVYFRLRIGDGAWELREVRIARATEN